jgi:hypothetical protein
MKIEAGMLAAFIIGLIAVMILWQKSIVEIADEISNAKDPYALPHWINNAQMATVSLQGTDIVLSGNRT